MLRSRARIYGELSILPVNNDDIPVIGLLGLELLRFCIALAGGRNTLCLSPLNVDMLLQQLLKLGYKS